MRTNIDIDDELMAAAMAAGRYKTKKEAVEAGLALIKRQADYARILELKGKLRWGWDDEDAPPAPSEIREAATPYVAKTPKRAPAAAKPAAKSKTTKAPGRVRR